MDVSRIAISELRDRLEDPARRSEIEALLTALREDSRAGARALAERFERRRAAEEKDRERVDRLFARRRVLLAGGARWVAGVDEAGMGPLAGPVVAGAVILGDAPDLPGLDDSKKLTRTTRERLDARIREQAPAFALAEIWPEEIDRSNIYRAGLEAMRRAVSALRETPDHVMVDARTIPGISIPQTPLVHGDSEDGSIAAASVLAKVHRDTIMLELADQYPGYGFERHKGYGTADHMEALNRLGPTPVHRRSFAPVARLIRA